MPLEHGGEANEKREKSTTGAVRLANWELAGLSRPQQSRKRAHRHSAHSCERPAPRSFGAAHLAGCPGQAAWIQPITRCQDGSRRCIRVRGLADAIVDRDGLDERRDWARDLGSSLDALAAGSQDRVRASAAYPGSAAPQSYERSSPISLHLTGHAVFCQSSGSADVGPGSEDPSRELTLLLRCHRFRGPHHSEPFRSRSA